MKVAVTIWKDRISPVFDVSRRILILEIENDSVAKEAFEIFENNNSTHMVSKLLRLNIETLICGAISRPFFDMLTSQGIKTIPFTCGDINDVILAFLEDALPDKKHSMPGCCGFRKAAPSQSQKKYIGKEVAIMPRGDGKGPEGKGPKTGKGKGKCSQKGQKTSIPKNRDGCRKQGGQGRGCNPDK